MKIYGPLIAATAEILSTDPTAQIQGRLWYNTSTPALKISNGTASANVLTDFLGTTKGDILARTSTGFARLGVGSDGQVLGALSSQSSGLQWVNPSTGLRNYIVNGDFEIGAVTGFSLANSVINITTGSPVPTSVAPAGTAASSATLTTGGSASVNLSLNLVSSSQLAGTYSASLVSTTTSTVGNMLLSNAFTVYKEDQARILTIRFFYSAVAGAANMNFSGTSANTFSVWIYDVTQAQWIQPIGVYGLTQSSGVGYVTASFQTTATSTQYQLALINTAATTGAYTLYVDDFQVGPQPALPNSAIITDWVQYPPTVVGFGTITSPNVFSRRVGSNLEVRGFFNAGTPTAVANSMTIGYNGASGNVNINTSVLGANSYAGDMTSNSNASTNYRWATYVASSGTTTVQFGVQTNTGNSQSANQNGSALGITAGGSVLFSFSLPIAGWSSNITTLNQDSDNRVCAASYSSNAQSVPSSTATLINLTNQIVDTHAAVVSNQFKVPITGIYEITVNSGCDTMVASGQIRLIARRNAVQIGNYIQYTTPITNPLYGSGSWIVAANATDLLDGQIFQANGATEPCSSTVSFKRLTGPATVTGTETVAASYCLTANVSVGNNATVTSVWNSKTRDTHGGMNTSTGTYIVPVSGTYTIMYQSVWAATGTITAGFFIGGNIVVNGTGVAVANAASSGGNYINSNTFYTGFLNAGAAITSTFANNGGASSGYNVIGGAGQTQLSIVRMGF